MYFSIILTISIAVGAATAAGPTHGKHIICSSLTKSLHDESAPSSFNVDNFDFTLCTHLITLDKYWYEAKDPWSISNPIASDYTQMTNLQTKYPHLKVLLALKRDSLTFMNIANNKEAREEYITNAVNFAVQYNFAGIELNFEQSKTGLFQQSVTDLVKGLSEKLSESNRILIAHHDIATLKLSNQGYSFTELSKYYEFISFAHGYHPTNNVNDAVELRTISSLKQQVDNLVKDGMSPNKIVVEFPYSSPRFITHNGETKYDSLILFSNVCNYLSNDAQKWDKSFDKDNTMAIAKSKNVEQGKEHVLAFENSRAIVNKIRAVLRQEIGGIKTGVLYRDDVLGKCGLEPETWEDFKPRKGVTLNFPKRDKTDFALTRTVSEAIEIVLDEIRQDPSHSTRSTVSMMVLVIGILACFMF